MLSSKVMLAFVPWLCPAAGFLALAPRAARPNLAQIYEMGGERPSATALRLSQSVNDDVGGFHYDQEPRGQSFMSEISKRDLWERRQMKRPAGGRRRGRRPPPASRGAYAQGYNYGPNGGGGGGYYNRDGGSARDRVVDVEGKSEFDEFKVDVSANLSAMTELLKEMQKSQSTQNAEVQTLSSKVASMVDRLGAAEVKNRVVNGNPPPVAPDPGPGFDTLENRNFGTSLDGEFNRKIKDVIDEFDRVDYNTGYGLGPQGGGDYYRTKIAQLEERIGQIDQTLQATEEKLDSQIDYVDQRLDDAAMDIDMDMEMDMDMDDGASFFGGMPFEPRPPPSEPFMEERRQQQQRPRPPPPAEGMPPPPPPPGGPAPREGYDGEGSFYADDGTTYYQERNYNDPFNPPPRGQEIPSSQKRQSAQSANERSSGHHYREGNASFISAFSKASNEEQRRFDPLGGARRGNAASVRETLPRGAPPSARGGGGYGGGYSGMRSPQGQMPPRYGGMQGGGMEEPYFYGGGGMMGGGPMMDGPMMGEEYYYDDMY